MHRKSIVTIQVQQNQSKSGILIISKKYPDKYPDFEIAESYYLPCNDLKAHLAQILDMSFSRYLEILFFIRISIRIRASLK